ncbi:MAG: phosphatase [Verrucomicrobia bacterium]|nr:phosphatase [Verrucomicrobiota bacterium]
MRHQFQAIRDAGFDGVINLALPTSDFAIEDEGSIVTKLGMSYFHMPVDFGRPTTNDFQKFCGVLQATGDRPMFIHCAANLRVSAFLFLYRVMVEGTPEHEALLDLHAIWHPDPVWHVFIQSQLRSQSKQNL